MSLSVPFALAVLTSQLDMVLAADLGLEARAILSRRIVNWEYFGCFNMFGALLAGGADYIYESSCSLETCLISCEVRGYGFASIDDGVWCGCYLDPVLGLASMDENKCDIPCSDDDGGGGAMCGGFDVMGVQLGLAWANVYAIRTTHELENPEMVEDAVLATESTPIMTTPTFEPGDAEVEYCTGEDEDETDGDDKDVGGKYEEEEHGYHLNQSTILTTAAPYTTTDSSTPLREIIFYTTTTVTPDIDVTAICAAVGETSTFTILSTETTCPSLTGHGCKTTTIPYTIVMPEKYTNPCDGTAYAVSHATTDTTPTRATPALTGKVYEATVLPSQITRDGVETSNSVMIIINEPSETEVPVEVDVEEDGEEEEEEEDEEDEEDEDEDTISPDDDSGCIGSSCRGGSPFDFGDYSRPKKDGGGKVDGKGNVVGSNAALTSVANIAVVSYIILLDMMVMMIL